MKVPIRLLMFIRTVLYVRIQKGNINDRLNIRRITPQFP